jgi:AcrR family transcriptional regulator
MTARPIKNAPNTLSPTAIADVARSQMNEFGTAGLSLRAIARELNVSAPAIYNYYPTLDDLITRLLVDAFRSLAIYLREAAEQHNGEPVAVRLFAAMLAYRDWAVRNSAQFQLIYGNPIPGYDAPSAITAPESAKSYEVMGELLQEAYLSGMLRTPAHYQQLPPILSDDVRQFLQRYPFAVAPEVLYIIMAGWSRMHGLILLEIHGHSTATIPHSAEFYRHEMEGFMREFGLI